MADGQPRRDAPAEGFANHIGGANGDGADELGHYVGDVDHTGRRSSRRLIEAGQRRHQQSEMLGNALAGYAVLNLTAANASEFLFEVHSAACLPLPSTSDWWRYSANGF